MQVEAALVQQSTGATPKSSLHAEAHAWAGLFSKKYMDRTLIGILMMFFQRKFTSITLSLVLCKAYLTFRVKSTFQIIIRMEWNQRTRVLRAHTYAKDWIGGRVLRAPWERRHRNRTIPRGLTNYIVYRQSR